MLARFVTAFAGNIVCAVIGLSLSLPARALDVIFEQKVIPAPENNKVELRAIETRPTHADTNLPTSPAPFSIVRPCPQYTVALTGIEHVATSQFFTYTFRVWRNSGNREETDVIVNVAPTGRFPDFVQDVPISVRGSAESCNGTISIPVHSLNPVPACRAVQIPTRSSPLRVFLGGETDFTVTIDCSDAVTLPRLRKLVVSPRNRPYWKVITVSSEYFQSGQEVRPVTTKTFELVKIKLYPNPSSAIDTRLKKLAVSDVADASENKTDEMILVDLAYAMQPAGQDIAMHVEFPIVFQPYITSGIAAASLGVFIGLGLSLILLQAVDESRRPKKKQACLAIASGHFVALVAWVLMAIAYGTNCRLQLFGVDINPFDVLMLFVLGLVAGALALLRRGPLLAWLEKKLDQLLSDSPPAMVAKENSRGGVAPLLLGFLLLAPDVSAFDAGRLPLIGLAACPNGDIIGLNSSGAVVHFPSTANLWWRNAGVIGREFQPSELTCAEIDGKTTAFIVAPAMNLTWMVRMDVQSGQWTSSPLTPGTSSGVVFDPLSKFLYYSSAKDAGIYRMTAAPGKPEHWVTILGDAQSLASLAVDPINRRLLVSEAYSGAVYAITTEGRRQTALVRGLGTLNSLAVDASRNTVYIADSGRRTIWAVPLSATAPITPRAFYQSPDLKGVTGLAVDRASNVWISIYGADIVRLVAPNGAIVTEVY